MPADFPWQHLVKIGQGTYGEVYKARPGPSRASEQGSGPVALKRLRLQDDYGFPLTSVRERKYLLALQHKNLVRLYEMFQPSPSSEDVYMVFEYLDLDVEIIVQSPAVRKLEPSRVKSFMQQLLNGLDFMHHHSVMHRDLKPSNLLVSKRGDLKICDLGLARGHRPGRAYTLNVVTLNYRAPELLLQCARYGPPVDLWSCGCILAELLERRLAIAGRTDDEYLENVWELCGPPIADHWPQASKLCPKWLQAAKRLLGERTRSVLERFAASDPAAAPLVDDLLQLSPAMRITAEGALDAEYFWSGVDALPEGDRALEWDIDMVRAARDDQRRARRHLDRAHQPAIDPDHA